MSDLQTWSCYVDAIDDGHVHLVMADQADEDDHGQTIGSFPRHLLDHLSPVEGQYVTVRVTEDGRIVIGNTPVSAEARAAGEAKVAELLALLGRLRDEQEERDDGR